MRSGNMADTSSLESEVVTPTTRMPANGQKNRECDDFQDDDT
jgi:hypothetical protein